MNKKTLLQQPTSEQIKKN